MHADLSSSAEVAEHLLYDPEVVATLGELTDDTIDTAARAGSLLGMYTSTDGPLELRVYFDEDMPDTLRSRISTSKKDVLLRVPSGKLVAASAWDAGKATESSVDVPAGNYLVDIHELDYDWNRDIAPVLRSELGGSYRREVLVRPVAGGLTIGGVGCLVAGALAWSPVLAIGGAGALLLGIAGSRAIQGKAYTAKKAELAKRFPGLVLVLRRLPGDADLATHAGQVIKFVD